MMSSSQVTQTATAKTEGSLFLLKLSKLLAVFIIFFSTTQPGLHFWPLSSLVYGIRIDYLAPTVYLLDLLILSYLVARRSVLKRNSWLQAKKGSAAAERTDLIGTLAPLLLTNLLYSQNPLATLSWSLHFLLYLFFALSLRRPVATGSDLLRKSWLSAKMFSRTKKISSETRSDPQGIIINALSLSLLFQTILAATQVYLGHSVGGLMYYLGERMVSVGSPGIALGSFMDQVVLRAYGTFSHPNTLAGFAVISYLILIQISQTAIPKASKQRDVRGSDPLRRSWPAAKMFSRLQNTSWRPGQILLVPMVPVALIVFLTQSRAAVISLFGIIIPFYLLKKLKVRLAYFVILLASSFYLLSSSHFLSPTRSDLSTSQRLTMQGLSLQVISYYPIFGTGAQSSISTYPQIDPSVRLLQPDHNSFTLLFSWFGFFGALAIFQLMSCTSSAKAREKCLQTLCSLGGLLPLLLLDHYLLTSPQGLFIVLLLIFAKLVDS